MEIPSYRGGWNEEEVAKYLLSRTSYSFWVSTDGDSPNWIKDDGSEWQIADDDDDRWYSIWAFVAERGKVAREALAAEYGHLCWEQQTRPNQTGS